MSDHYHACTYLHGGRECDCRWPELLSRLKATENSLAHYAQAAMAPENEVRKRVHDLENRLKEAQSFKNEWHNPDDLRRINQLESRLQACRDRTIVRGVVGAECRLCRGEWSYTRTDGELHEDWCPNRPSVVEKHEQFCMSPVAVMGKDGQPEPAPCRLSAGHDGPCENW